MVSSKYTQKAILFNNTRVDAHHGSHRVINNMVSLLRNHKVEIVGFSPAHQDWRMQKNIIDLLPSVDILIVNAEGTIHHNRLSGKFLLAVGDLAKKQRIPSVLINATWNSNSSEYISSLKNFDIVSVRESESKNELANHGIDTMCIPDLSLYGGFHELNILRKDIGIVDSVLPTVTRELYQISKSINGLILPIHYPLPGLNGEIKYLKNMVSLCRPKSVWDWHNSILFWWKSRINRFHSSTEYIQKIATLEGIVSGRFHAICFALLTKTPFIAIESNTFKISSLINDIGLSMNRVVPDVKKLDLEYLKKYMPWSKNELDSITTYIQNATVQIEKLIGCVAGLCR